MKKTLLLNLALARALDEALRAGKLVRDVIARHVTAILFQANDAARHASIVQMEGQLTQQFAAVIQPQARQAGETNAKRVLAILGLATVTIELAGQIRLRLSRYVTIARTREQIVSAQVNDAANTLLNKLKVFWLDPTKTVPEKLAELKRTHAEQATELRQYDAELKRYQAGETKTRPKRPALTLLEKFTADVITAVRQQARRAMVDAEQAAFERGGHQMFVWITVNKLNACQDCIERQGMKGDSAFWDKKGRPGEGFTRCQHNCYCVLVPDGTVVLDPSLNDGLHTGDGGEE